MKRKLQILSLLVLCLCAGSVQAQMLQVKQLQADFDSLRHALAEVHGGLYRYSTKGEMNRIFNRHRQQLNHPMTTRQFVSVISRLLPAIRDGHLRLELDPVTAAKLSGAELLPLRFVVEDSKFIVLFNDTPVDHLIQPGMELIQVNGHNAADLLKLFSSRISGDGYIETGKWKRAGSGFGMLYWLLVDTASRFTVVAKDADGKIITANLPGTLANERGKNSQANPVNNAIRKNIAVIQGPPGNISLQPVGENVAALRIKSFGGDDFYPVIDSIFGLLHTRQTNTLILDLRGNGGGVDEYGAYLVAQFMNRPFRYFDHIRMRSINPSFTAFTPVSLENFRNNTVQDKNGTFLLNTTMHSGVGEQQPGKNLFRGKLVVLMDGGTFSTAADVVALLRHLTSAIFIGEESGGGYEGNTSGSSARFIFPYSKLMLNINLYDYYNAVKPAKIRGRGTMPDYPAVMSIKELLNGVDTQWEKAMEIAKRGN